MEEEESWQKLDQKWMETRDWCLRRAILLEEDQILKLENMKEIVK